MKRWEDNDETWDVCAECGAIEQGFTHGRCNVCNELDEFYDPEPDDGAWPSYGRTAAEIQEEQAAIQQALKR